MSSTFLVNIAESARFLVRPIYDEYGGAMIDYE